MTFSPIVAVAIKWSQWAPIGPAGRNPWKRLSIGVLHIEGIEFEADECGESGDSVRIDGDRLEQAVAHLAFWSMVDDVRLPALRVEFC